LERSLPPLALAKLLELRTTRWLPLSPILVD
jgi:hypothetical protein